MEIFLEAHSSIYQLYVCGGKDAAAKPIYSLKVAEKCKGNLSVVKRSFLLADIQKTTHKSTFAVLRFVF